MADTTMREGTRPIALAPLDERPVSTGLVEDVAAIAGAALEVAPAKCLPSFRTPGDTSGLARWLTQKAADGSDLVVSIDMLAHGGLIAARTDDVDLGELIRRLGLLRSIRHAHPDITITGVAIVMRATDSYSNVEEPDYWSRYGRELHALGASVHAGTSHSDDSAARSIPAEIRADFAHRRLRNHVLDLAALDLAWENVFDTLVITSDDTAPLSAGSAEQEMLAHWQTLAAVRPVLVYPGADETGAVMVARLLAGRAGAQPRISVFPGDPAGLDLVPSFENVPLQESVRRQAEAAGAVLVARNDGADLCLVIHTPDPGRRDMFGGMPDPDAADAIAGTVTALERALETGKPVVLADLRYTNGGDLALVTELARRGLLDELASYGGWNTAGNALGGVVASGVAYIAGRALGTLDTEAVDRACERRLLDDVVYQSHLRREVTQRFGGRISPVEDDLVAAAEDWLTAELPHAASEIGITLTSDIAEVTLPWRRSFEVGIRFDSEDPR
ncbi:MAG: DUF4127 family protein [Microbacterium sp.]|uniref:DUF4127 family protein n=1 Tax=Microbacterium sp. TaxID=51671 RepID=UPI00199C0A63|nr:DUF4127 family protein [Microbacterium sp.]MBD3758368.1 DUF4127 family protein [Microbacterium sp.]